MDSYNKEMMRIIISFTTFLICFSKVTSLKNCKYLPDKKLMYYIFFKYDKKKGYANSRTCHDTHCQDRSKYYFIILFIMWQTIYALQWQTKKRNNPQDLWVIYVHRHSSRLLKKNCPTGFFWGGLPGSNISIRYTSSPRKW